MLKVAIVGATGFTGSELVRLLLRHPQVEIIAITSESRAGESFSDVHNQFKGFCDLELIKANDLPINDVDIAFLALPHGVSMSYIKKWHPEKFKIIDLSGDFRLSSAAVYEEWYNKSHILPEAFGTAVFGLPELNFDKISSAKLIANPGCYPTCSILGLSPLAANNIITNAIVIIDAKSGLTGAGVKANSTTHFSNVNENFKAYGLLKHRHSIEITEQLSNQSKNAVQLLFTPHLLPIDRGILATIYVPVKEEYDDKDLRQLYNAFYKNAPFVKIVESPPSIKDVKGSNYCNIFITYDKRTQTILIVSVIDNLVKGASGQAIQNMNIMSGLDEDMGIKQLALKP